MTLKELLEEIEDIKQDATEMLIDMHNKKVSQNTYRVGYEKGIQDICKQLLEKAHQENTIDYEKIIKGLIEPNIIKDFIETNSALLLRYRDKMFDITVHSETDKRVIIHHFYEMILEYEAKEDD